MYAIFVFYSLTPESVRWLMVKGKTAEALNVFRKMAKVNKTVMPDEDLIPTDDDQRLGDVCDLFATRKMVQKTILSWYCWWVIFPHRYDTSFFLKPKLRGQRIIPWKGSQNFGSYTDPELFSQLMGQQVMQLKKKLKKRFINPTVWGHLRIAGGKCWKIVELKIFFPLELNELLPPAQDSNFGASVIIKSYRAFICLLMY